MMKKRNLAFLCALICSFSASACTHGKSTLLAEPAKATALSHEERTEEAFVAFKQKADDFSARLSQSVYQTSDKTKNLALSPISVFMALSLAAECTDGDTQAQLLSALGVDYNELKTNISKLYRSLEKEYVKKDAFGFNKTTGQLKLTNSIWVDESVHVKDERLSSLSENYYCYSYSANFLNDNESANQAIRNFVKTQTKKKIDRDFSIPDDTLFTLINTLYLKDLWDYMGNDLSMTGKAYDFTNSSGSTTSKNLLVGDYLLGRPYETDAYSYFYTSTYHGYQIKFILPKEGYSVEDIFRTDTLLEVNAVTDFTPLDEEHLLRYNTRCLFPEYKASYHGELQSILKNDFGVLDLFSDTACNFTPLTDEAAYCKQVIHSATLEVDRSGIEGAAVTIIPGAGAAGPGEYTDVYVDFVVDKAFGFILTDPYDVTLFSGVIEKI